LELAQQWEAIMLPWFQAVGIHLPSETQGESRVKEAIASKALNIQTPTEPARRENESSDTRAAPARGRGRNTNPELEILSSQTAELEDLVIGDLPEKPWQTQKYSADSAPWQGAALRRKIYQRR